LLFKKKIDKNINFLNLTPYRKVEYEVMENSLIRLLIPRFKSKFAQKYLIPKFQSKFIYANLDEIGSACFQLIDGFKNVYEISNKMRENFGESIEPVYDRVAKYMGNMHRTGFLDFKEFNNNISK
jgi:hypothetical protein